MSDPLRDCPHGHRLGKCDTCELIEAEKRIALLEKENESIIDINEKHNKRIAEQDKKLAALREQAGWIPVSEKLPENKKAVLIWCPMYKNIYTAYLDPSDNTWQHFGSHLHSCSNVTHWMPLPAPPQETGE